MAERGRVAQAVHRQGRRVTSGLGRVTAPVRVLPDFLIVGAQRAGTTSLYRTLTQHRDVLPAGLHKGVHWFDTSFDKSPSWYRGHFPTRFAVERARRSNGVRPITGEASPYYMFHPAAPARIAEQLPTARLVVLLRDPVERAYSAYTHERARGFETLSFPDALAAETSRLAGEEEKLLRDTTYVSLAHQHNAYLARGRYIEQLERLEAAVGRDRLCVVDSDELFTDATYGLGQVTDFLGLEPLRFEAMEQRNARPRSKLDAALRAQLEEHFAPYDERLADWWGRQPRWRR